METPNGNPKTNLNVTETGKPKPRKSLLTEELPGGGLTQEEFSHSGRNAQEEEGEEEEEVSGER